MKKNLLFIIPSLAAGGGEKSLVNLLSQINFRDYHVDLFLLNHEGIFMEFLPQEVNVIPLPDSFKAFSLPFSKSILRLLLRGKITLAFNRVMYTLGNKIYRDMTKREQYTWRYLDKSLIKLDKRYDAAIGFLEKTSTYFCVDKVEADKKIGWVHIDYDKLGMDPQVDMGYFNKLDHIVTVSEECANVLKKRFPNQRDKVDVIYNIVSPTVIQKMANLNKEDVYNKKEDEIVILSIGRLHYQKGFEMAIQSCKLLVDKGYNIKWYVIGEGEERANLVNLIKVKSLEENFILLGLRSNPYPFIKHADIYAQTSRFEGKSIAIDEAKILNKPILVTNFSTAKDQIDHDVNGVIVEMDPSSIANGIEKLIINKDLREMLGHNLSMLQLGTEQEIEKLYRLLS